MSPAKKSAVDPNEIELSEACSICRQTKHHLCQRDGCTTKYVEHHRPCPICYLPEQHHDEARTESCWSGRARMAAAARGTRTLTNLEVEALKRHPDPPMCGEDGYR